MNRKVKNTVRIAGWIMLALTVVAVFTFSSNRFKGVKCTQMVVKYAGRKTIRLSENELIRLAKTSNQQIIGNKMENIDTEAIEKAVSRSGAILTVDAYKSIVRDSTGYKGAVTIKVRHRKPALRIFSPNGSYYVDKEGSRIPVSVNYAADVPVATGNISAETTRTDLLPLVEFIQNDKFWKAQIKQIQVTSSGEFILTTLVGNQLIEFGTAGHMKTKFRNLKAFYEQVLKDNNWNKYSRIILKFENQVIAKKS
ncbi:MAG TPA: cell division protein FtsQ/DivIB [Prolixibacteraceae bacterium]|nr:cell division protein FtsQ/DivIB [Prolixibacteraceae bacterium]